MKFRDKDGTTVEVMKLSCTSDGRDGIRYLVRDKYGYTHGEAASVAGLAELWPIDLGSLEEVRR